MFTLVLIALAFVIAAVPCVTLTLVLNWREARAPMTPMLTVRAPMPTWTPGEPIVIPAPEPTWSDEWVTAADARALRAQDREANLDVTL